MNWVIKHRPELKEKNYVLKNSVGWIGLSQRKINFYKSLYRSDFNIILFGDELIENDYYFIPYSFVEALLVPENLSTSKKPRKLRWLAWVRNQQIKIGNSAWLDIPQLHGSNSKIIGNSNLSVEVQVDYSNKDAKRTVLVRLDRFRSDILGNFDFTCCLTGTKERNLLDACHIKPRSHDTSIGRDPKNGLCLTAGYHRLFDRGYFSFDENLHVVVTKSFNSLSIETQNQLSAIKEKDIVRFRENLNLEALLYHYKEIFEKQIHIEPEPDELLSSIPMDSEAFIFHII